MVIDATEWEYETHMRHAKDRVVSVTYIFLLGMLWTHFVFVIFHNRAQIRN